MSYTFLKAIKLSLKKCILLFKELEGFQAYSFQNPVSTELLLTYNESIPLQNQKPLPSLNL